MVLPKGFIMKVKVVQCWDDGPFNDIRLTGMLREYGAKATFNLNPGCMGEERLGNCWVDHNFRGWNHKGFSGGRLALKDIPVVYKGFEVASHNWFHENAGRAPDDVFIDSALRSRRLLEDLTEKPCLGFAWPCGRYTPETISLLRDNGFAYGRTTASTYDLRENKEPLTMAASCHFQAEDFWERYEKSKETGFFYFWGHSYELFEYDALWASLEDKIKTITEDPDAEWANVIDIVPLLAQSSAAGD